MHVGTCVSKEERYGRPELGFMTFPIFHLPAGLRERSRPRDISQQLYG